MQSLEIIGVHSNPFRTGQKMLLDKFLGTFKKLKLLSSNWNPFNAMELKLELPYDFKTGIEIGIVGRLYPEIYRWNLN